MSNNILPQQKMPKLIVVAAFDQDDEGGFVTAFEPAQQQTEERAVRLAQSRSKAPGRRHCSAQIGTAARNFLGTNFPLEIARLQHAEAAIEANSVIW